MDTPTVRFKVGDKVVICDSGTGWRKWTKATILSISGNTARCKDCRGRCKTFYLWQLNYDIFKWEGELKNESNSKG